MPSKLLRRSGYRTRFVLLVLVMMTGMLGLVPVMRNYHEREEMLLRRLKLQEMEPKGPTPPRMPIDDLLQMLPDIPRVVNSTIPKLIHQSYKTTSLPGDFRHYQKSWHRNHPTWLYQFWTDEDNRKLVELHFPWFLETYDKLPQKIMRPDASRYMYMYLFGGVYADLDMESLQPLDPLLANQHATLAWMGKPDNHPHNMPNAFMASEPGHPFWLLMLTQIVLNPKRESAEMVTGPVGLKTTYFKYWLPTNRTGMTILGPGLIYPIDWARSTGDIRTYCLDTYNKNPMFDTEKCKELIKGAYTVTYWRHSWEYARRLLMLPGSFDDELQEQQEQQQQQGGQGQQHGMLQHQQGMQQQKQQQQWKFRSRQQLHHWTMQQQHEQQQQRQRQRQWQEQQEAEGGGLGPLGQQEAAALQGMLRELWSKLLQLLHPQR